MSAVNIDALADLVMEKYRRRQLIKVGKEIVHLGYETETELLLVLSLAEAKVFTVTQNQSDERCKVFSAQDMAFEVGKITRQIRDIAKSHKIPVFLGCQINRGNQTTADKRPNRHLLRNSGEIFEVCDQLIMLYRDAVYTKDPSDAFGNSKRERTIELIVEKNRLYGKLGTATMLCDLSTSKFLNLAR